MTRRAALGDAGIVVATVAVAGVAGLSYRVFDTAVLDPDRGRAFDPWRHWRDDDGALGAVAAAILAANPHNTQPWAFHIEETGVDIYADERRRTGTLDPFGRELHIGLGCALENLVIAARANGLAPAVTLVPDRSESAPVASVSFTPATPEPSALADAIGDRHTNRGPFDERPVDDAAVAALVDDTDLDGVAVHWITSDGDKETLGTLLVDAAQAITDDEDQSRDSFSWFRSNDDQIQRHCDGLTLDGQGLPTLLLTVAKLLPATSRSAGDSFWVDQTRDVHTKTAAAYGVITVDDPYDRTTQLVGGRLLERIHLTASARGLALHHMNQITERIDRERDVGSAATFEPRFAALLPSGAAPLATFRVGHPGRSARRSPRRSVDEVLR